MKYFKPLITNFAEDYIREQNIDQDKRFTIRAFALAAASEGYAPTGKFLKEPEYKDSLVKSIVTCEGLVYGLSGFAEAMRNIAYFLNQEKINVCIDPHDQKDADNVDITSTEKGRVINELSKIRYIGDKRIRIVMTQPKGVLKKEKDEYLIAYIMFETVKFPKEFIEHLKIHADEIWTPSQFNVDNIKKAGWKKPVFKMPLGVDINRFNPDKVQPLDHTLSPIGYFKNNFVFLSMMGWSERKGVSLMMEAYIREFSSKDNTVLYIKGGWYDRNQAWRDYLLVNAQVAKKDPPIVYIDFEIYPDEMLPRLYKTADAFVLASRGEGWGLNYTEAMAMELPTIGTFTTSMKDFMNETNSFPVKVKNLKTEPRADWITPEYVGEKFANPDIDDLRLQMRKVFQLDQEERNMISYIARRDMKNQWTWGKASQKWIKRLKEIKL